MGWRGTVRTVVAAARQIEQARQRQQRELLRQAKSHERLEVTRRAASEVAVHESYIDLLESVHKGRIVAWDWRAILAAPPPPKPEHSDCFERTQRAREELNRPTLVDKLLGRTEAVLAASEAAIQRARAADTKRFQESESQFEEWRRQRRTAERVLAGDLTAFREVLQAPQPLNEIPGVRIDIGVQFANSKSLEATLEVMSEDIVPTEDKTLLKTGNISLKRLSQSRRHEIYQNYVCGCAL
jgi:hypothetical protein